MNVDLGRKVPVQVMLTTRLLDKIDAIAANDTKKGDEANRSRTMRELLGEAIDAREGAER
jgi:metal-responsive CopG/Arc/MetJ family transcriptional regulator